MLFPYYVRTYTNILFLFFVDFELGDLKLAPRTLGMVNVKVVELCIVSFSFFLDFRLVDLDLTPRTLRRGI